MLYVGTHIIHFQRVQWNKSLLNLSYHREKKQKVHVRLSDIMNEPPFSMCFKTGCGLEKVENDRFIRRTFIIRAVLCEKTNVRIEYQRGIKDCVLERILRRRAIRPRHRNTYDQRKRVSFPSRLAAFTRFS